MESIANTMMLAAYMVSNLKGEPRLRIISGKNI
jgi:hypothetical protein